MVKKIYQNLKLGRILAYLLLLLLSLIWLLPILSFILNAFTRQWFYPQALPEYWTLEAWEKAFRLESEFFEALSNSLLIALSASTMSLILGFPAGRALGLHEFRGKQFLEFFFLLPALVPPLAISLGLSVNFVRWGLTGHWFGVAIAHLVPILPYVILILSNAFKNYPIAHELQAASLGANPFAILRHITLPLIFPNLVVALLFAFLISWSQYILTLLIGSGRVMSLPMLLFSAASGSNNSSIAVYALLFIAPSILLLLLVSRVLSKNLLIGF